MSEVLKVRNVETMYGRVMAIRGVSLSVREGTVVTVMGSNGAGKTTILKTISGALDPFKGEITFKGKAITGLDPDVIARTGVAHSPEGREVFALLSVKDNLMMGAYCRKDRDEVARDFEKVLGWFPVLREFLDKQAIYLSGGQQQMVALGRAFIARPSLMLRDEPSRGLSPRLISEIFAIIKRINVEEGMTMLCVTHEMGFARQVANRVIFMDEGQIVEQNEPEEFFNNPQSPRTKLFLSQILGH